MSVLDAIGNTPLIDLSQLTRRCPAVQILGKLEGNNPGGSVKDRTALWMVQAAEKSGQLTRDRIVLEATSGNTGIALAMIGAAKGYRVRLCMSSGASQERRSVLEALGAEIVLTPAGEGTDGAIRHAHRLLAEDPDAYYMPNQFENENNILAHYESTGPEILRQTEQRVDVFIGGMGTTGTLMGVSRCFRERKRSARVIGVEPPMGHSVQGLKNMCEAIRPAIYDASMLHDKIAVVDQEAFEMTRRLAIEQGVFVGMSAGAAVAGAVRVADRMSRGLLVVLLPDRGDRYLSTNVYRPAVAPCQSRVA